MLVIYGQYKSGVFAIFRSKMCFRPFSTVPLNSPIGLDSVTRSKIGMDLAHTAEFILVYIVARPMVTCSKHFPAKSTCITSD